MYLTFVQQFVTQLSQIDGFLIPTLIFEGHPIYFLLLAAFLLWLAVLKTASCCQRDTSLLKPLLSTKPDYNTLDSSSIRFFSFFSI